MNAVNNGLTGFFDLLLAPFELIGDRTAMILVSGIFGVLALWLFKYISWQAGIKLAKDRIKGHMIEIRIYQDDLVVVGQAVVKILLRNFQYVGLNFGPFVPLAIPFFIVAAQFIVRYSYDPVPVTAANADLLAGQGTLIEIRMKDRRAALAGDLTLTLPEGVRAVSPLVRSAADGRAFQEVVALTPGEHEIRFSVPGSEPEVLKLVAGTEATRTMQPRRVANDNWYRIDDPDICALLWPAAPGFTSESPFATAAISYPERDLGWLPGGEMGILITFVLASMVFGLVALKPLGVQI